MGNLRLKEIVSKVGGGPGIQSQVACLQSWERSYWVILPLKWGIIRGERRHVDGDYTLELLAHD